MTTTPEAPAPTPPGPAGYPYPPAPGAPTQEQGTSGLAIAGLILAFLLAPLGFVLSLVAVFTTGGGRKKGRGLAIAGLVISVLLSVGGVIAVFATVGKNVATIADPGCTKGKTVLLNAPTAAADAATAKKQLQTVIDGLNGAAAQSKNNDVRNAMKTLAEDYAQIVTALNNNTDVPPGVMDKITTDANAIDDLCTLGGARK